jgi:hypothetical protein
MAVCYAITSVLGRFYAAMHVVLLSSVLPYSLHGQPEAVNCIPQMNQRTQIEETTHVSLLPVLLGPVGPPYSSI